MAALVLDSEVLLEGRVTVRVRVDGDDTVHVWVTTGNGWRIGHQYEYVPGMGSLAEVREQHPALLDGLVESALSEARRTMSYADDVEILRP